MKQEYEATTLQAVRYEDLAKQCKVFNLSTLDYHIWIYLNPETIRDAYMYKAIEIGPKADNSKLFKDTIVRESECWVRANMQYLNNKPGKHTYRLMFANRYDDTDFSLYFSYIIQDDNPEKPYVYMKEDGASTPVSGVSPAGFTLYEG